MIDQIKGSATNNTIRITVMRIGLFFALRHNVTIVLKSNKVIGAALKQALA